MIPIYAPWRLGFTSTIPKELERFERDFDNAGKSLDRLGSVMGLTEDDKKKIEWMLAGTPVVGDMLNMRDVYAQITDYMRNTGLTWSDIMYPSRTPFGGFGSSAYGILNFTSSNLTRLYRKR